MGIFRKKMGKPFTEERRNKHTAIRLRRISRPYGNPEAARPGSWRPRTCLRHLESEVAWRRPGRVRGTRHTRRSSRPTCEQRALGGVQGGRSEQVDAAQKALGRTRATAWSTRTVRCSRASSLGFHRRQRGASSIRSAELFDSMPGHLIQAKELFDVVLVRSTVTWASLMEACTHQQPRGAGAGDFQHGELLGPADARPSGKWSSRRFVARILGSGAWTTLWTWLRHPAEHGALLRDWS
ncbi:hypothetical protein SELMODRAFT_402944 [Selaginella moellendorffii]|uniref:Uncharacterized protein n=1 Tax=Selaginella moellendorffii TaxID=88036 RepID=D8QNJ3_SELML|nr:hypothetical protein SELMODRAFT_402944 [Selaginella moellendorffii]